MEKRLMREKRWLGRMRAAVAVVCAAGMLLVAESVAAQGVGDGGRHPEAADAISKIRSPFCPGQMLEICTSSQAAMWRDSVTVLAEGGMTSDQLVELLVSEYGEEYRAMPKTTGAGLLAWVAPPLALLLGLLVVAVVLRRLKGPDGLAPAGGISEEDEARLAEAMAQMEEEVV